MATSVSGSETAAPASADGPVLLLVSKKLRALKKKYTRILQLEESQSNGKTLNMQQSDLLKSKPQISILIEEYEKLRQPLSIALQEELSLSQNPNANSQDDDGDVDAKLEDLITILYFGCLFDVKSVSQSEFARLLLTRTHERGCCLTYDYVTDDATELLGEGDLDMISALGGLLTTRPVCEGVSHKEALEGCVRRAKMWVRKSGEPIMPGTSVTYAKLREKLNKIMALDYFTMTPEMKAPVDVAAAVGKYNSTASQIQVGEMGTIPTLDDLHIGDAPAHYQQKEEEHEEYQAVDASTDQPAHSEESEKGVSVEPISSEDNNAARHYQEKAEHHVERNPGDSEHSKGQQQFFPRRGYQGQRGGRGVGGPRRGYPNARGGGRRGRGGGDGGSYQNGRSQQYYDSGYSQRGYYSPRGRGGGRHNNNYGPAHGGQVELGTTS